MPAIVLHPSLGRPAADFGPILAALASAGHSVHPVESGTGDTLHDLADGVIRALDAADIARAHLVGHAFGNRVMRCAAADHPDRVASVALFGAGGRFPGDDEATAALGRIMWDRGTHDDVVDALRIAMFAPGSTIPDDWVDGWDPDLARAQHAAASATAITDWWTAGTTVPVLVVQGLDDRMAPPANGRALVDEIGARARLLELTGMGHAMLPERPADLAAALLGFLDDIEG
ncbi:MAG: alpha/beta hydrolase [Actinobacteria bacterium]|nr:alpha/beta hydrolase [Actinomycetota bacterium]